MPPVRVVLSEGEFNSASSVIKTVRFDRLTTVDTGYLDELLVADVTFKPLLTPGSGQLAIAVPGGAIARQDFIVPLESSVLTASGNEEMDILIRPSSMCIGFDLYTNGRAETFSLFDDAGTLIHEFVLPESRPMRRFVGFIANERISRIRWLAPDVDAFSEDHFSNNGISQLTLGENLPDPTDRQSIPGEIPAPPRLEFTGAGGGWPPRPREQQQVEQLEAEPIPGDLTDELEQQIRSRVLEDPRVRELLGDRFVHLSTNVTRSGKQRPAPLTPLQTGLLFFSHATNTAVGVLMSGLAVKEVEALQRFQPSEVPEEVEDAVALAREHPLLRDAVAGLSAGGLLLRGRWDDPSSGHRIIWVTFTEAGEFEGEVPALYTAAVDLITRQVLQVQQEAPIMRPDNPEGDPNNA